MHQIRFLSTRVHGVLDYVTGSLLVLSPWVFGFAEIGGPAMRVPMILGIAVILYSLLADYELGLWRTLPMRYHLALDLFGGILLALSPWIFEFSDEDAVGWLPHVIVGLALIGVYFISRTTPEAPPAA
jgi:hypothetical protein